MSRRKIRIFACIILGLVLGYSVLPSVRNYVGSSETSKEDEQKTPTEEKAPSDQKDKTPAKEVNPPQATMEKGISSGPPSVFELRAELAQVQEQRLRVVGIIFELRKEIRDRLYWIGEKQREVLRSSDDSLLALNRKQLAEREDAFVLTRTRYAAAEERLQQLDIRIAELIKALNPTPVPQRTDGKEPGKDSASTESSAIRSLVEKRIAFLEKDIQTKTAEGKKKLGKVRNREAYQRVVEDHTRMLNPLRNELAKLRLELEQLKQQPAKAPETKKEEPKKDPVAEPKAPDKPDSPAPKKDPPKAPPTKPHVQPSYVV